MNIGEAARRSGIPAKTIRYYEEIGLIDPADRTQAGYRSYDAKQIEILRFIQRARGLGFSVKDVESLLALWQDRARASADVKSLAREQVQRIEEKIAELRSMQKTLETLIHRCHGDDRPDCPILEGLSGQDSHEGGTPKGDAKE